MEIGGATRPGGGFAASVSSLTLGFFLFPRGADGENESNCLGAGLRRRNNGNRDAARPGGAHSCASVSSLTLDRLCNRGRERQSIGEEKIPFHSVADGNGRGPIRNTEK